MTVIGVHANLSFVAPPQGGYLQRLARYEHSSIKKVGTLALS